MAQISITDVVPSTREALTECQLPLFNLKFGWSWGCGRAAVSSRTLHSSLMIMASQVLADAAKSAHYGRGAMPTPFSQLFR